MTTKKKPDPSKGTEKPAERGRYARLLADGDVVEVEPARPPHAKPVAGTARPGTSTT